MWRKFAARVAEVQDREDEHVTYGVVGHLYENTGEFDYVAGIHVTAGATIPEGMVSWDVPAQTYAVFSCTLPTLGKTFETIHGTWLPTSEYRHAGGPELELYDESFDPQDPESPMYLYIPVEQ